MHTNEIMEIIDKLVEKYGEGILVEILAHIEAIERK